ncbi:MAG: hypothetical protein A2X31_00150 [Elusimicrobia bacterium GWB2_63_22]|nr:MAG: hypothetical protein A2X31_00150 [Elusimicrobia bacterium GWB2_63_22]
MGNERLKTAAALCCAFSLLSLLPVGRLCANTPQEAAAALVEALKSADPGLWYRQLSKADVDSLHEMIGEHMKNEFEKERAYRERELGKKIEDIYEFKGGQLALSLGPYSRDKGQEKLFDLFFIKDIRVWGGQYAEVTLFLPVAIRGVLPPVRLSFIKEAGEWKFCQSLSTAYFVHGRNGDFDYFVNMYLNLFYGLKLDRTDSSKIKRKSFRLSKELSDKYFTAWKNMKSYSAKDFLAMWLLTGDKKAIRVWEEEKTSGKKTLTDKELEMYKGFLSGKTQPSRQPVPPPALESEQYFQYVKGAFFRDILAYKKLLLKFPGDEKMCAKAKYQIAENYEYAREYALAEMVYLGFLKKYPAAEDEPKAQANLAKLYWDKLGKQDEAVRIWKELDAKGKLPADAPYKAAGRLVPKTLVQNLEAGYMRGIVDFDIEQDGKWTDVLYTSGSVKVGGKEYVPAENKLVRYLESGQGSEIYSKEIDYGGQDSQSHLSYRKMQATRNGIWLYTAMCNGHALFLSPEGRPLARLRDEGDVLADLPLEGREGPYPWKYTNEEHLRSPYWQGVHFADKYVYVYAANSVALKKYDAKTKSLISKTVPAPGASLGNYSANMAPSAKGTMFVVSPEAGVVLEYNDEGKVVGTIKDVRTGVQFGNIRDMAFDKEGNMYAALETDHQIAVFSKDGKLVNSFIDETVTPTSVAVDGAGDIYVSGYGMSMGGTTVKIYDRNGKAKTSFSTLHPKATVANVGIRDLAVTDDGFVYVRVDTVVERYTTKGERVDYWVIPNSGQDAVMFAADPKRKKLFMLKGLEVYEYGGPGTKKIADLRLPEKPYSPVKMVAAFGADKRGNLQGHVSNIGVFSFDPDKISGGTVPLGIGGAKYGSQISLERTGLDRDGNIWSCNSRNYGKGPVIEKYGPDGKQVLKIPQAEGTRNSWKPVDIVKSCKDELLVADSANRRIAKYTMSGKYLGDFDLTPYMSGWIQRLRVDSKERLYILSSQMGKQFILRFDGVVFKETRN